MYNRDITYGTNNEFDDYLRDNMSAEKTKSREGMHLQL